MYSEQICKDGHDCFFIASLLLLSFTSVTSHYSFIHTHSQTDTPLTPLVPYATCPASTLPPL